MRILVLAGGESKEREVSLNTGKAIAVALKTIGHDVAMIDTRDGRDLLGTAVAPVLEQSSSSGPASKQPRFELALPSSLRDCDCVFIALHGGLGENGTLQAMFDLAGVPYTGSGVLASALAMDKQRTKLVLGSVGVPSPRTVCFGDEVSLFRFLGSEDADFLEYPMVVKPNCEGSTVGLSIVHNYDELLHGIRTAAQFDRAILVEEFIPGRELTVAILGEEALPVVEIVPKSGFYDYHAKYTSGASDYFCPADITPKVEAEAKDFALTAFNILGCSGYARVDFRLNPDGELFCLEVNTLPGMTSTSLVPKAAKAAGLSFEQLLTKIIELSLKKS